MPFAAQTSFDEDEEKKNQSGGVNVSGTSTSFATGVPGQEAAGGKPQSGSGDKFANIQSYLDVNKDQGDQMGQKIQSDVTQNADTAKSNIDSFATKAPKVEAYDPSEAYNNVTSLTDADKQKYNQNKQGYKGPQNLDQVDGYQDTQKSVSKAATQVGNAGNEAGQRQLLKDTYKRPSYSAGENALDQTIVQNSPNSRKGFEDLTQKYAGLNSMFDQTAQNVGTKVNEAVGQGLKNQQAIRDGEGTVVKGLLDPIKQRATQANQSNQAAYQRAYGDLEDLSVQDDILNSLGLADGTNVYDLDLRNFLTPDQTQVGIDNVATQDERQKYAALTNLINGTTGQELTADGKAINPYKFNQEQFQGAVGTAKTNYDRQMADFQGQFGSHDAATNDWASQINELNREWDSRPKERQSVAERNFYDMRAKELTNQMNHAIAQRTAVQNAMNELQGGVGSRKLRKG